MKKIIGLLSFIIVFTLCLSVNVFAETEVSIENDYSILKELEIMVGDTDGNMRLEDSITRAEFTKVATMISSYRKSIALNQKTSPFYDVPYKHWAVGYIRAGVDNGILTGYPDSSFKPNNDVLYEEALTVLLKILGYGDGGDFQGTYPYSQYSLANSIDLTDDVDAELGDFLTRKQVADLLVNALNTNIKNTNLKLFSNFNIQKYEDTIILATSKEDVSVPINKVLTTSGTFKYDVDIDKFIGQKVNIYVENNENIILVELDEKSEVETFVVYSTMADGIIAYKSGDFEQIEIDDNTITYYNNKQSVFSTVKNTIQMGDSISVYKSENEEIDYIKINKGDLKGPFVYTSETWYKHEIGNPENYLILKNGNIIDYLEIEDYDVYYYSVDLGIILVYNAKVTGVYNNAIPNQEVPISVEISGKNYEIESTEAFKNLSSTGKYKYGDTITILLGKDKKIAGVIASNTAKDNNVGYLISAGVKNYETDTNKMESKYYVTLVTPNGEKVEYKAKKDYGSYVNSVVEIIFVGDVVTLNRITERNFEVNIKGKFNLETYTLDKYTVSKNVKILDICESESWEDSKYVTVTPQRIDGVTLSYSNILYYEINERNAITKLILNDVTGDCYEYGVIMKVNKHEQMLSASYKYNIDGTERMYQTQNSVYSVKVGPARFDIGTSGINGIRNISKIDGKVTEMNNTFITIDSKHYLLSDKVKIFCKNDNWDYMLITMEELLENEDKYSITGVYSDKAITSGGRVRIILVSEK